MREAFKKLVEHSYFHMIITSIIFLNGVVVVAETYTPGNSWLLVIDKIILVIFVLEIMIKMVGSDVQTVFL